MRYLKEYEEFIEEGWVKNLAMGGMMAASTLSPLASQAINGDKTKVEISSEDKITNNNLQLYIKKLQKDAFYVIPGQNVEIFIKNNINNKEIKFVKVIAKTKDAAIFSAKQQTKFPPNNLILIRNTVDKNAELIMFYY